MTTTFGAREVPETLMGFHPPFPLCFWGRAPALSAGRDCGQDWCSPKGILQEPGFISRVRGKVTALVGCLVGSPLLASPPGQGWGFFTARIV